MIDRQRLRLFKCRIDIPNETVTILHWCARTGGFRRIPSEPWSQRRETETGSSSGHRRPWWQLTGRDSARCDAGHRQPGCRKGFVRRRARMVAGRLCRRALRVKKTGPRKRGPVGDAGVGAGKPQRGTCCGIGDSGRISIRPAAAGLCSARASSAMPPCECQPCAR